MTDSRFFVTGGTLRADAESYVPRSADSALYDALNLGEFCYVLTSRQMGKSSLMVRNAARFHQQGVAVVILDLTAIGQNLDPEQWYFGLLGRVGVKLKLEADLEDYWTANARVAPLQRWVNALREVVLEKWAGRIVIFVDEIDYVRSLPFRADEFFAGIRECYNRRTQDDALTRLTFCLLGVATPSELIRDQRMTPFNIGYAIELNDFTAAEAEVLVSGFRPSTQLAHPLLDRVLHWTAGHPYLTQRLCEAVVREEPAQTANDVDRICERVFLSAHAREHDANLHFVRERMLHCNRDRAALLDLYAKISRGSRVPDDDLDPLVAELKLAGIVRVNNGRLAIRNRIYARVFDISWTRSNLPDAERQRQHAAFVRGVLRTITYAVGSVLVMSMLVVFAFAKARDARDAKRQAIAQAKIAEFEKQDAEQQKQLAEQQMQRAEEQARRADALAEKVKAAEAKANAVLASNQTKLFDLLAPALAARSESREVALKFGENLYAGLPEETANEPTILAGRAKLLRTFSQLYRGLGNLDSALKRANEALEITRGVALEHPESADWQRDLSDSYNSIGDVYIQKRQYGKAAEQYQSGFQIAEQLHRQTDPPTPEAQRLLFQCYLNLGDAVIENGDPKTAYDHYASALNIAQALYSGLGWPDDLAAEVCKAFDRMGDALLNQNKAEEARVIFDQSLKFRQRLVDSDKENADKLDGLSKSFNKLGRTFHELAGNKLKPEHASKALEFYQKSLGIRERLAMKDQNNLIWQRNLSFTQNNIGSVSLNQRDFKQAFEFYGRRLKIAERLAMEDPTNADWREDLQEALNHYSYALISAPKDLRDAAKGLQYARRAVDLSGRTDPRFLKTLALALHANGNTSEAICTDQAALTYDPKPDLRKQIEGDLTRFKGNRAPGKPSEAATERGAQ